MLTIVIPAYNEESRIEKTLFDYKKKFPKANFIIISDSSDRTGEIARKYGMVINHKKRVGKGFALKEGLSKAKTNIVGFADADGSVRADDFGKLIQKIERFDIVIASKKIKGSEIVGKKSLFYNAGSKIFNIYINALFSLGIKDTQCGAKVFRKDVLDNILPYVKTKGFETDVEILWLAKKRGFSICEMPVSYEILEGSKFRLIYGLRMALSLLRRRFEGRNL